MLFGGWLFLCERKYILQCDVLNTINIKRSFDVILKRLFGLDLISVSLQYHKITADCPDFAALTFLFAVCYPLSCLFACCRPYPKVQGK